MGVAKRMKDIFGDLIDLNIYTNDSPEAKKFNNKSAVKDIVNGDVVPLRIAISSEKMEAYLIEQFQHIAGRQTS